MLISELTRHCPITTKQDPSATSTLLPDRPYTSTHLSSKLSYSLILLCSHKQPLCLFAAFSDPSSIFFYPHPSSSPAFDLTPLSRDPADLPIVGIPCDNGRQETRLPCRQLLPKWYRCRERCGTLHRGSCRSHRDFPHWRFPIRQDPASSLPIRRGAARDRKSTRR